MAPAAVKGPMQVDKYSPYRFIVISVPRTWNAAGADTQADRRSAEPAAWRASR